MSKRQQNREYFTTISNAFIRSKEFDKKLLLTMIWIDRRRFYEGDSSISLAILIENSGYKLKKNNTGVNIKFKDQLRFMADNEMIKIENNLDNVKPHDVIEIEVLDNFDPQDNFTMITASEIDTLLDSPAKIDKSKLFAVYLYIKSRITIRNLDDLGNEFPDAKDKPMAFWESIQSIVDCIGVSKETVNKCLKEYLELGLLKRHVVGSFIEIVDDEDTRKNSPNIYVLNLGNWQQEIDWALNKIKERCKTKTFGKPALRHKKDKISKSKRNQVIPAANVWGENELDCQFDEDHDFSDLY